MAPELCEVTMDPVPRAKRPVVKTVWTDPLEAS